jgi:hypothetical protein
MIHAIENELSGERVACSAEPAWLAAFSLSLSACAAFYAGVHPQLLTEQALSFAGAQNLHGRYMKIQHREKLVYEKS